jgi:WD40 repeat protein/tRNA A-37 threonylcarbamoyl transferase component Bud32
VGRTDDEQSGLEATVAPTEPPSRPSGLEATVAPAVSGIDATQLPSGARAAVAEAAGHDAQLTVVDQRHYKMLGEFARGGLGRIVKARDTRTGRLVAIKEMLGSSSEIARRFMREALLTANLQHPAIVPVYELGKWPNGEPFYAMKLVDGRSFEDVLAGAKTLDARLALLPTLVTVAEALAYAHGEKIIHRDLKPANVLVGKFGETIVIDWGLAKRLQHDDDDEDDAFAPTVTPLPTQAAEHQTLAGSVMGTPAYMPPEQARGDDLDPRADVYALGAILYHLLSGAAPYAALRPKHVGELLRLVENGPPPRLEAEDAPADLIAIVDKAMARDPADRYPTAKGLADDLRRFTTGQLVGAHHYDRWTLIKRWLLRHRAAVTVAGVLLVVLSAVAVVSLQRILEERARAEAESARARAGLALALAEKGDAAERDKQWGRAAMYYQASLLHADDRQVRFSAGRAEARTIALAARHVGHRGWVHALALAGDEAVSVDEHGEVRRWAIPDGRLLASWKSPTPLHAVAVSADGARVAVGGDDGVVRMLDRALVPRGEHRGHTKRVFSLAFSRDGHLLASGSADASIRVIDDRDGSVRTLAGHQQRVYSVAFSRDGTRLASASDDRTARIWKLSATTPAIVLDGHPRGGVKVAAWFPDGERVFTTGWDRQMKVWDARTGQLAIDDPSWQDSTSVHAGVVAANGNLIVTGGDHAIVKVWDPATRSLVAHLDGHVGQVSTVAVSTDTRWLISAGRDGTPRIWDLGAAFRLARLGHQKGIRRVAFAPDGKTVITSALDNTIRQWDAATGVELRRMSPLAECNDGASLIGGELAAGCGDGNLYVWAADGMRTLTGTDRRIRHAVTALDDSWVAAGHVGGWMHVWDAGTGKLRASREIHDHNIYGLRALPDGTLLTAALDNTVRKHDSSLQLLGTWRVPGIDGLLDAAIDPRGRFLVAGGDGFPVFKWDLTTPEAPPIALAGHTGTVWSVDVSPDGALVASASSDGTIRLWDTTTWTSQVLRGPKGGVLSLAFSPAGQLVSGHQRGAVIVWDVARRIPIRRLGASEAGELGSCDGFDAVAWNDPAEKAIVLAACLETSGFSRMSARTHLILENEIDLVEKWSKE